MRELLSFVLLGLVLLTWLGNVATPRHERLPLRRWTPVHVADLIGRGVKLFGDAGKERSRRQNLAREEVEGRRPGEQHERPMPPPPPNPEDPPETR